MDAAAWKRTLLQVVNSNGGTLENGWTVEVKQRPTGARDVTIRGGESGQRFRSITQAIAALTGQGSPAAPLRPLQSESKNKKRSRAGDTDPDGSHGARKRRKVAKERKAKQRASGAHKEGEGKALRVDITANGSAAEQQAHAIENGDAKQHPIFSKVLAKAKTHVSRIRRERDIIEVYEAEGWRGSNRDKLKPRAEMQRAEEQIERSKAALRELLARCEEAEGAAIPAEHYDSDGELDETHIFCAICGRGDSTDDNDIVLCDGPCGRAYHAQCTVPAFVPEELSEEADWLCPACQTKDDILDLINEEFETGYELDAPAAAVLVSGGPTLRRQSSKGAGGGGGGGTWASLLGGDDLVSSDTDDDDFREEDEAAGLSEEAADAEEAERRRTPGATSITPSGDTSSSSGDEDSEEEEEEVVEGKRRRAEVDYRKLNAEMFGDEEESEEDKEEGSDGEWD